MRQRGESEDKEEKEETREENKDRGDEEEKEETERRKRIFTTSVDQTCPAGTAASLEDITKIHVLLCSGLPSPLLSTLTFLSSHRALRIFR